jgi:hypothetical protein
LVFIKKEVIWVYDWVFNLYLRVTKIEKSNYLIYLLILVTVMETINKEDLIPILRQSKLADQFDDEIIIPKKISYKFDKLHYSNK